MKTANCEICKKIFSWRGNRTNRFTCSKKCQYTRFGNIKRHVKRPKYIGEKISASKIGTKASPQTIEKLRLSHLGKKLSEDAKAKLRLRKGWKHTIRVRERLSKMFRGKNSYAWKGGITPMNNKIRKSLEYKLWREAVFQRDNYTCIWCGERGGKLNADHIKSFSKYPALRFAIDNGRTLCERCHKKTDTWGGKIKN